MSDRELAFILWGIPAVVMIIWYIVAYMIAEKKKKAAS